MTKNITPTHLKTATLGAGCFWCVEAIFQRLEGVHSVAPGYAGGKTKNPTYKEVCSGTTGHAEVARIEYDPNAISFQEILEVFWSTHNPTTLNRQGNDIGTQYRSAIFYHDEEQRIEAENSLKETDATDLWPDPIVTQIVPLTNYTDAEDYHFNYFNDNGEQPYCTFVIRPKVEKFQTKFSNKLKKTT